MLSKKVENDRSTLSSDQLGALNRSYPDYVRYKWFEIQSTGAVLSVGVSWGLFLLEAYLFYSNPAIPLGRLFALHLAHTAVEWIVDKWCRRSPPTLLKPLVLFSFLVMSILSGYVAGVLDAVLPVSFFWSLGFFISAGLSVYPQRVVPALLTTTAINGLFLWTYISVYSNHDLPALAMGAFFAASGVISTFASTLYHSLLKREFISRKQTEYERELHYRTLQAIGDGVVSVDLQGRVLFTNYEGEKLLGRPSEAAEGLSLSTLLPWLSLDQLSAQPSEIKLEREGERERWLSVAVQTHPNGGSIVSFQDITARKESEKNHLIASKMESMSLLAGEIAHNFNNVLTVIQGQTSLLVGQNKGNRELAGALEIVQQATEEAAALAKYLLTFAPGGEPILELRDLPDFLKKSLELALAGSGLQLEFDFPPDLWPARFDSQQFGQVLRNLTLNAVEAMSGEGKLVVWAENRRISDSDSRLSEGPYVVVRITDHGAGIAPDALTRIFDPYFSTKPGNTGLGLTTGYSVMARHRGFIEVESVEGDGTTVVLYLPAFPGETPQRPEGKDRSDGSLSTGGRVLIMDDEESIRRILQRMLERLGFECISTSRGEDAVAEYRQAMLSEPFRCVLLDLVVQGGMGGEETLAQLKEIDPNVVAIVASGYSNEPIMASYQEYGFSARLPKPFGLTQLRETLVEALGE